MALRYCTPTDELYRRAANGTAQTPPPPELRIEPRSVMHRAHVVVRWAQTPLSYRRSDHGHVSLSRLVGPGVDDCPAGKAGQSQPRKVRYVSHGGQANLLVCRFHGSIARRPRRHLLPLSRPGRPHLSPLSFPLYPHPSFETSCERSFPLDFSTVCIATDWIGAQSGGIFAPCPCPASATTTELQVHTPNATSTPSTAPLAPPGVLFRR